MRLRHCCNGPVSRWLSPVFSSSLVPDLLYNTARMQQVYRHAASILVLRPVEVCAPGGECQKIYQILLLHKPRKKDSWQLPQGGMEQGEDVTQAALRELKEEASLDGCRVIGKSERVYQYDFPDSFRRFRPDNVCGQKIEYVFALAPDNPQVVVDGKEVDAHAWIGIDQLTQYVRREEYLEIVRGLFEEAIRVLE